ncbi:PIG-L deacetylase family protein [Parasphingorhabdus pacifica]
MPTDSGADFEPRRALVVTAHPDDVDFGSAGTIAALTSSGARVSYCVCTSGDAGGFDDTPRAQVPGIRQAEQRAAAEAVGVTDVHFLGYQDGRVTADLALRRDITRVIRTACPDLVITHSPEINWARIAVSHPDHRAVGEATLDAVYPDARNEFAHPELLAEEGLRPWRVRRLWLSETPDERINHAVDITDHMGAKLAALAAHRSQTAHLDDLDGIVHRHAAYVAQQHGLPSGHRAEAFQAVDTS